jgi:hypothetical protein
MEWQPIETAPKDGTELLGYQPARATIAAAIYVMRWEDRGISGPAWYESESEGQERFFPTHWMRLPPPPVTAPPAAETPGSRQGPL